MENIKSARDVLELIHEVENRFKPQSWKIEGIDIWPILRVNLYCELTLSMTNIKGEKSFFQQIRRAFDALTFPLSSQTKNADFLFVSDGISYVNMNSNLYERFCDPMIELVEAEAKSWLKWNITGNLNGKWAFQAKRVSKSIDRILIWSKFKKRILINLPELDNLCNFINEKTEYQFYWTTNKIASQFQKILAMEEWFLKKLKVIKPSVVVIVGYYSDRCMALISACNRLKIKSTDIQHGIQGELHAAYSSWQRVPELGFNTLPHDFLVWSRNEGNVIDKWSNGTIHDNKILGNLFEERWFTKDNLNVIELDKCVAKVVGKMSAAKTALFTIQYGLNYDDWIFKLIEKTQSEFNWLIRLHPVIADKKNFNRINKLMKQYGITNYELDYSTSLPLYSLMRNVNIHVTHSSSAIIEAKNFGILTIILSAYGAELFGNEIKEGNAFFCKNVDDHNIDLFLKIAKSNYVTRILGSDEEIKNESKQKTRAYLQNYI